MRTRIGLSLAVALGLAGLQGCGGADDGSVCVAAPIALTQGTWCMTITGTSNPCGGTAAGDALWVTMTQDGSALTMTSQYGITYVGTVCGDAATVTASGPPADVVTTVVFTDASTGSGSAHWDVGSGCNGTDTFTTAAGSCP